MKIDLELSTWGDDSIRLAFWDSIHGKDRIYILNADGSAHFAQPTDDPEGESDEEALTVVELVTTLRRLLADVEQEREPFRR